MPVYELKISLAAAMWRRVLVPEKCSLGRLHQVIRVLFGCSGHHLHVFNVGRRRYSDPFARLEECGDEGLCHLKRVLPAPRSTLSYTYDLGDCWQREIVLEKVLPEETPVGGRCGRVTRALAQASGSSSFSARVRTRSSPVRSITAFKSYRPMSGLL
ncbi:plasmid pRiA4b ORF-3 family protein [Nonomuraea sp. 10N515B]|uniref:plasmid pRiA4b ORF-3 family protein n=1 Tax=Nonomuraea sp. 10N515B TaxID=3457422 RepID=UPI003FCDA15C